METAMAKGCSLADRRSIWEPTSDKSASLGLVVEREFLDKLGFSQDAVRTIQGECAASTTACYAAKWIAFQKWCLEKDVEAIYFPLSCIVIFSTVADG